MVGDGGSARPLQQSAEDPPLNLLQSNIVFDRKQSENVAKIPNANYTIFTISMLVFKYVGAKVFHPMLSKKTVYCSQKLINYTSECI